MPTPSVWIRQFFFARPDDDGDSSSNSSNNISSSDSDSDSTGSSFSLNLSSGSDGGSDLSLLTSDVVLERLERVEKVLVLARSSVVSILRASYCECVSATFP